MPGPDLETLPDYNSKKLIGWMNHDSAFNSKHTLKEDSRTG